MIEDDLGQCCLPDFHEIFAIKFAIKRCLLAISRRWLHLLSL